MPSRVTEFEKLTQFVNKMLVCKVIAIDSTRHDLQLAISIQL